jgi:DNA-binding transcriptional regulator YdaS (Cro superfamily)
MNISAYTRAEGGTGKINCPVLARVADRAGCSFRTLYMIALGHKRASPQLAQRIQSATDGAVSIAELRPDLVAAIEAAGYTRADPTPTEKAA